MKKNLKLIALMLLVLMAAAVMLGCAKKADSESDLQYILDKGKLVVGITEFDPANYYDEDGTLIGFDTEMAQAACKELGIEAEFLIIDWDSKDLELKSKNIDCIWNMMGINEERKEFTDFSLAYIVNGQILVVKADRAAEFTSIDDANQAGVKIVFEEGSTGQECAEENFTDADCIPVAGQTDAMLEVKAGTADCAVIDKLTASSMIANSDYSDLMIVPDVVLAKEYDAIGFRKGSDAVAKFNEILKKLYDNGTADQLAEKYALQEVVQLAEEGD